MSHRFSLFYAGYTSYIPSLFFNRLAFLESINGEGNEVLKDCIVAIRTNVEDSEPEARSHLQTAVSLAEHFKVETLNIPNHHVEYFDWLRYYIDTLEAQFPMNRIDHYYFLYARKIAEITCNIGLLRTYNKIAGTAGAEMDLARKYEKCLKDTEYILFKLMAPAALLSSQPRQNYFNTYYKSLSDGFLPLKDLQIGDLRPEGLNSFESDLSDYELAVTNGFKQCIGLLKELGI